MSTPAIASSASHRILYALPLAGTVTSSISTTTIFATAYANPNPSPPPLQDDHQWINAYLTIHQLSMPSYRYMYIFWLAVVFIFLVFAVLHWTGRRGGALGGLWSKWSLRRRTWRKEHSLVQARRQGKPHKQPMPLPSNAQLLSLATLYVATLFLCFLGPDYIAPGTHVWDFTHNLTSRGTLLLRADHSFTIATSTQPNYTIPKAWWTSGGRTGTMVFALFPLCVLFALKSPPFALFALPFLIQIYNDKLAFLHRWTGRLIWFITALHVSLWGVQLGRDKRETDNPLSVWSFAFEYNKFVFGWLGFICLTLLVALSFRPVRTEFYETFYILHVCLVPLTLAFSALHFPPIGWWCWAALAIWGGERIWRLMRFLRINGIIGGMHGSRNARYSALVNERASGWQKSIAVGLDTRKRTTSSHHLRGGSSDTHTSGQWIVSPTETEVMDVTDSHGYGPRVTPVRPFSMDRETMKSFQTGSSVELIPRAASSNNHVFPPYAATPDPAKSRSQWIALGQASRGTYIPPPGYAHATLLPGRTIRLRLIPPHHFTWAPGQHVLLTVPSVTKFTSHPFTIASICDSEALSDMEREIVILIRARSGFTKDLWSHIENLEDTGKVGDIPSSRFTAPGTGVLLRAYLDGPFGSSIRARWTSYSTVLIIAGGSGVSFAAAILEYACMCMAGRNGKSLGGMAGSWGHDAISQINRVRFVWVVREFSHIQWVASIIRRCMDMVPSSVLQIDIFVTNIVTKTTAPPSVDARVPAPLGDDNTLAPPTPRFAQSRSRRHSNASDISLDSAVSSNTFSDLSYIRAEQDGINSGNDVVDIVDMYGELGHEEHVLDLTNFDGEDDTGLPGESQLSYRLRKEGKVRRARTRKFAGALLASQNLSQPLRDTRLHSSLQSQQGPFSPEYVPLGSHSHTPSRDVNQPSNGSRGLHSSVAHGPLLPLTPVGNPSLPLSPSAAPHSFLYPDAATKISRSDSPVNSSKSEAINSRESEHQYRRTIHHSRKLSKFDMDEAEAEDMPIVAERARPGKAKIDRIVADEAGGSRGAMVVACCGPTSLNAMVRKSVAAQIDPIRILRGTQSSIALVSEDFEW